MRWSKSLIPTFKERPKNVKSLSHSLSIRAGLIRPLVSGVHSYLPLGWRVFLKIIGIIREEMTGIGGQELALPSISPSELWEKTGRWEEWGKEMFKFKDRRGRDLCLMPTHEEIITELAHKQIHSYKDLPQIWYQIQTKFRDEPRPRGGVLRAREFVMKDSYSLDADEEGLKKSYELHREAYARIFTRCGLSCEIVEAPSGVMGGGLSEEFMVLSKYGEDSIMVCSCSYKANREVAKIGESNTSFQDEPLTKVYTPVEGSVDKISEFLRVPKNKLMKSLLYFRNSEPIFILLRGDHELSQEKLNKLGKIRIATSHEVKDIIGTEPGYVSPIGLSFKTIAAISLKGGMGLVTGANEDFYHFKGVNLKRDLKVNEWIDLETPNPGDPCPKCGAPLTLKSTIEVGHIFNLGTRYSIQIGAYFLDKKGKKMPIVMGSYGIGIERVMAAIIETHHDKDGIIWPTKIAPYQILIIPLDMSNCDIRDTAEFIYSELKDKVEVLIDDRIETAGVKFKDADLIGIPLQIIVGEKLIKNGEVEIKSRDRKIHRSIKKEKVVEETLQVLNYEL
ncbi:MAG: proline--tRNA ligase [bacterium]|nr:proline--tRNA ligase [bacterium]